MPHQGKVEEKVFIVDMKNRRDKGNEKSSKHREKAEH